MCLLHVILVCMFSFCMIVFFLSFLHIHEDGPHHLGYSYFQCYTFGVHIYFVSPWLRARTMLWAGGPVERKEAQRHGVLSLLDRTSRWKSTHREKANTSYSYSPMNCRELAMALCLFHCLVGPTAHSIGRARTWA